MKKLTRKEKLSLKLREKHIRIHTMSEENFESTQKQLLNNYVKLEDRSWGKFLLGMLFFVPALIVNLPIMQVFFIGSGVLLLTSAAIEKTLAGRSKKEFRLNKNFRNLSIKEDLQQQVQSLNYGQNKTIEMSTDSTVENQTANSEQDHTV